MPKWTGLEPMPVVGQMRMLLHERRADIPYISRETGLPRHWLRSFSLGRIRDPSYTRLVLLAARLGFTHRIERDR